MSPKNANPEVRPRRLRRASLALVLMLALVAAACSGSDGGDQESADGPTIIQGENFSIEVPDDFDAEANREATEAAGERPESDSSADDGATAAGGSDESAAAPTDDGGAAEPEADADADEEPEAEPEEDPDAIPLNDNDDSALNGLFDSFGLFNECLDGEGTEFLGVPDGADPDAPQNQPAYLASLQKCAAESNIIEAFQAIEAENASLTPDEIELRNQGYLIFEDCLRARGWDLGEAEADQYGVLGPPQGQFNPPDGETILDSDDIRECGSEAQRTISELQEAEEGG